MFAEISEFNVFFKYSMVHLHTTKHWFEVEFLIINKHGTQGIFEIATPPTHKPPSSIMTDKDYIISSIQSLRHIKKWLRELITVNKHPVSLQLIEEMKLFTVQHETLYSNNLIEVPNNNTIQPQILKVQKNSKLSGDPGQAKTLSPVKHSPMWLSMTDYVHCCTLLH